LTAAARRPTSRPLAALLVVLSALLAAAGEARAADLGEADYAAAERDGELVVALPDVSTTTWVLPSTAHLSGAGGAFWTSDVTIHNRGAAAASFTLKFLGNNADGRSGPEKTFSISAFQTITNADVLASVFGVSSGWGAIQMLSTTDQLTMRSRTFTPSAGGGSFGQAVPGIQDRNLLSDATTPVAVLTGLREDASYRTNLVLANASQVSITLVVAATGSGGAAIGSKSYLLPPLGMTQSSSFLLLSEFGEQWRSDVTVTVRSATPGTSFTAYATVIDNATNDPSTVLPQ
jgi:hypothetical protein